MPLNRWPNKLLQISPCLLIFPTLACSLYKSVSWNFLESLGLSFNCSKICIPSLIKQINFKNHANQYEIWIPRLCSGGHTGDYHTILKISISGFWHLIKQNLMLFMNMTLFFGSRFKYTPSEKLASGRRRKHIESMVLVLVENCFFFGDLHQWQITPCVIQIMIRFIGDHKEV